MENNTEKPFSLTYNGGDKYYLGVLYWVYKDGLISGTVSTYTQTFTSDVNKIFGASWLTINNDRKLPDFSSLVD